LVFEFAILTAARGGEARGATWNEVDLNAAMWTVPAERMKASKAHTVPLSNAALGVERDVAEAALAHSVGSSVGDGVALGGLTRASCGP